MRFFARRGFPSLVVGAFALFTFGCPPSPKLFRSGVAGTIVADASSKAAGLATVYLQDSQGHRLDGTITRANQAGRFRITAAPGDYTLVATDDAGSAAYTAFSLADGQLLDLGPVLLQPCAFGTNPNADVYQTCPDPVPVASPPPSFTVSGFTPDRVEATLYDVQSPSSAGATQELFVVANDDAQHLEIDVWIPSSSPYFAAGSYGASAQADDPTGGTQELAVSLVYADPASGAPIYYVLESGTFDVEALDPQVGGSLRVSLSEATFDFADPTRPALDQMHQIHLAGTAPIEGTIYGGAGANAPSAGLGNGTPEPSPSGSPVPTPSPAGPPPASITVPPIAVPDYVQGFSDGLGGVSLSAYTDLGNGALFALDLDVPAADLAPGTYAIANTVGGPPSSWSIDVYGDAWYSDATGSWQYVLANGTLTVDQGGASAGDTFSARLTGATFDLLDETGSASASYTLQLSDSGTLTMTLTSPDGGTSMGPAPWTRLPQFRIVP